MSDLKFMGHVAGMTNAPLAVTTRGLLYRVLSGG